jgi:hypothetical protein
VFSSKKDIYRFLAKYFLLNPTKFSNITVTYGKEVKVNDLSNLESFLDVSLEENIAAKGIETVLVDFVERLDFLDVQILRKFYSTGREFPLDTQPHCFPILFKEMRDNNHLQIGAEALRKRLDNLVRVGLLGKISNSNPTNYTPLAGKEQFIRAMIMKFFLVHGLTKFL